MHDGEYEATDAHMGDDRAERITVYISLFADLRRFAPADATSPQAITLPHRATVEDLRTALAIPAEAEITAGLNGEQALRCTILRHGDHIMLFNALSGGQ